MWNIATKELAEIMKGSSKSSTQVRVSPRKLKTVVFLFCRMLCFGSNRLQHDVHENEPNRTRSTHPVPLALLCSTIANR